MHAIHYKYTRSFAPLIIQRNILQKDTGTPKAPCIGKSRIRRVYAVQEVYLRCKNTELAPSTGAVVFCKATRALLLLVALMASPQLSASARDLRASHSSKPLSCRTDLGSTVAFLSDSHTGSTSGPSMSPAPSQPQHHTANKKK